MVQARAQGQRGLAHLQGIGSAGHMSEAMTTDLTGQLLIAMPGIGDPRFECAVVFLCAHSAEGTMGLVINRKSEDIAIKDVLSQLDIETGQSMRPLDVYIGGPVEAGRGFVLHSSDYEAEAATLDIDDTFAMTASRDVLRALANGEGPKDRILCLGYAGWGPGQLEDEIAANGWLTCDSTPEIVFNMPDPAKWEAALLSLGVSPALLSGDAGHA